MQTANPAYVVVTLSGAVLVSTFPAASYVAVVAAPPGAAAVAGVVAETVCPAES